METVLVILSFVCVLLGVVGSILPVIPGTPLSWVGLLILKFTDFGQYNWWFLVILLVLVIAVQLLDYVLPAYGTKKLGGSKYAVWGTSLGLILGIIFSPFGLVSVIIMPFLGALIGEYVFHRNNEIGAFKAALGAFLGFLLSTGVSLFLSLFMFGVFIYYVGNSFL